MPTKSASKMITRAPDWLGPAIPPGEVLPEEFLKPLGLGQVGASRRLGVSLNRLNEIVLGTRGITADTALRLARLFQMSPQFWMRLQADWDLDLAIQARRRRGFLILRHLSHCARLAPSLAFVLVRGRLREGSRGLLWCQGACRINSAAAHR